MTGRPRRTRGGRPQGSRRVRITAVPREQPDLRLIARALLNLAELQATEKERAAADGGKRGNPEANDE